LLDGHIVSESGIELSSGDVSRWLNGSCLQVSRCSEDTSHSDVFGVGKNGSVGPGGISSDQEGQERGDIGGEGLFTQSETREVHVVSGSEAAFNVSTVAGVGIEGKNVVSIPVPERSGSKVFAGWSISWAVVLQSEIADSKERRARSGCWEESVSWALSVNSIARLGNVTLSSRGSADSGGWLQFAVGIAARAVSSVECSSEVTLFGWLHDSVSTLGGRWGSVGDVSSEGNEVDLSASGG